MPTFSLVEVIVTPAQEAVPDFYSINLFLKQPTGLMTAMVTEIA